MSTISPADSARISAEIAENYRAKEEEKDRLALENEKEIQNLKNNYETEKASLTDRFEQSIQYDKGKYYENVRNQKKQLARAEEDLSHRKDEVIAQREQQLTQEQLHTETDGKKKVDDTRQKYATAVEYENKTGQEATELARHHYQKSAQSIAKENEQKIGALYEQKQAELEFASARNKEAIDQMHRGYQSQQADTNAKYAAQVRQDQTKTQADLNARRMQNAQLMSAYSARQDDPFYKMVKPDAEITDAGDAYVLRVRVPEHERDQFRVQISGQEIQLSGTRVNQEKAEIAPGNWISTNTYQNYTEKYPLAVPVDAKTLVSRADGEWMEYEVLKHGEKLREKKLSQQIEADQKADRVTSVDFPKSLPQPTIIPKKA